MSSKKYPYQADFSVNSENWGQTILKDGTMIETRVILADLIVFSEDVLGPQVNANAVTALRFRCTSEIIQEFKNKPLPPQKLSLTSEDGWKKIEVASVSKPTQSVYTFNDHLLVLTLLITSVVRNERYKNQIGLPLYEARWQIEVRPEGKT